MLEKKDPDCTQCHEFCRINERQVKMMTQFVDFLIEIEGEH